MTTTSEPTSTGRPKRLGHYSVEAGERQLVAQRVDGVVQLRDQAATDDGRSYVVEPELHSLSELEAIVADYLQIAKRLGEVPMRECWY